MIGRRLLAVAMLAVFGWAKLPYETALDKAQRAANFRTTALNLDLRERVGQMGFLAALSGFRAPLAALLWIEAYTAWENTEWGRMAGLFDTVTTLQPRSTDYWEQSAWHMAWNASVAAMKDERQPREALRRNAQRHYIQLGRNYLERGIKSNPDRYNLYLALGNLLREKEEDHCAAAEAYRKAAQFPGAPGYVRRLVGYELAKCPEKEREAHDYLRKLYDESEDQHLPTLISTLQHLEDKLAIPASERIKSPPP